jgi:hypothetical protein
MSEQLDGAPARRGNYFIRGDKTFFRFRTGREIEIQNISPLLGNKLRDKYPRPVAPKQKIPTADGTDFYYESRESDPDYLEALEEWQGLIEDKSRLLVLQLGVVPLLTLSDADRRQVQQHRKFMREVMEIELEDSDEFCFASYILIQSVEDFTDLCAAVMNRSTPTEEAIANTIAMMFPANIQG